MIFSDLHIHSEYSYDSNLTLQDAYDAARAQGVNLIGITDHVNYNDEKFLLDLRASAKGVCEFQKSHSGVLLGVELTPISKPEFDYIAKNGTGEGFVFPVGGEKEGIELAVSKEELISLGVRYGIGASHWRIDVERERKVVHELDIALKEWYRQQIYLACDERVTILGHPWAIYERLWYEDFSLVPQSMKDELTAALLENGKYAECNADMFGPATTEKFRYQYAEYMRSLFEAGIPITYGSDAHKIYTDKRPQTEKYLAAAGFKPGDLTLQIAESDLW